MFSDLSTLQPTKRFSNRVENYVRYRPSYPAAIVPFLEQRLGLLKDQRIVDVGCGTGLFAEILLKQGYNVIGIEPNEEMRAAGDKRLSLYPGFTSRRHRAEQTGLRHESVDLITVAQAFHWMDPERTKKEFERILKPDGHIVLAWNLRKKSSVFMDSYQKLKEEFAMEPQVLDKVSEEEIREFFFPRQTNIDHFDNVQMLDFDSLKGQLLSSSYIPLPDHESYDAMISRLIQLFVAHNENGFVKMEYETKLYWI
ncbi:class I SAM-dependent methyltransferase [Terrimonas sp. NA20]|uniref:Class I SAM-dependent methyltransferase n=1 Tax=Terrimonas ginsenosidimutans TaxID=2908004 RepID=A0ABS9KWR7_9BACT|nr:class I SAM-dependent methyltransferase [Terrimonas ginsenosidimutans]MCG2616797.1 class I SAM-dependent methyltransferase [Terrimonas ginsenosidimutans]